MRILFSS